jgi:hypothetical protein
VFVSRPPGWVDTRDLRSLAVNVRSLRSRGSLSHRESAENVIQNESAPPVAIDAELRAIMQTAVSRILIGPYGLHAFVAAALALFLAFLWVFNFTTFF